MPCQDGDYSDTFQQRKYSLDHLPWRERPSIKLRVTGLPPGTDTLEVWRIFGQYGNIDRIDIEHNTYSQPWASIIFKPPPVQQFWQNGSITFQWRDRTWRSLVSIMPWGQITMYETRTLQRSYEETLELDASKVDFGMLYTPDSMKSFHTAHALEGQNISIRINLRYSRLEVEFHDNPETSKHEVTINTSGQNWLYRFLVPFITPMKLSMVERNDNGQQPTTELIIQLESPPEFSRRYAQKDSHLRGSSRWDAAIDPWYRVISLGDLNKHIATEPASLHDPGNPCKIGRWLTYRLTLKAGARNYNAFEEFVTVLAEFNLVIKRLSTFDMVAEEVPSVFDLLDSHAGVRPQQPSTFAQDFANESKISLEFSVRYQLEVCISEGWLSEYHLDKEFLEKLKAMNHHRARGLLIGVAAEKKKIFKPMSIFNDIDIKPDRLKLPPHSFYARSVTVTPTTMYIATPSLDVSNRVIRRYREHTNRFIRVRFAEERPRGKIRSTTGPTSNMLYMRIKHVLMNGVVIGDRCYQFLAWGNSQLREHTAYFFCSTGHLSSEKIRSWMGDFNDKVVAKYAARLGQCFSTTRAVVGANIRLGHLEDIWTADHKFIFTDGVGVISEFMAVIAANELSVLGPDGNPPSALQFRLGGCKGVLAVWPSQQKDKIDIRVRRSQEKFRATYQGLEIIRWSNFSSAYLNRQLIAILATLGVADSVFVEKLEQQLFELDEAMRNPSVSAVVLQRDVDPNQISLELANMVKRHFQHVEEPFMLSVLQLWKAYTIKYLKEKARILIHQGANLLGVVDELGLLKGHFHRDHVRVQEHHDVNALPEIFVQLSSVDGSKDRDEPKVIEGLVLLARNPSLHVGDIRVVRAVDIPQLRHLKDVVVLPQTGDRDIASMCSGGDLDGDDYVVIWDQSLIPSEWNHEPMDFTPPPPQEVKKSVTVDDITSFFVQYVKNDALGSIAHAHLAWSDQSPDGAKNIKCLELAKLHSTAVDYPKSGHAAVMTPSLRPKTRPHFMEKPGAQYHSKTALGKIYDRIQRIDFAPDYEKPFDSRILDSCTASEETLKKVTLIKAEYDEGIRRIMAQHEIQWELEVWSTYVLHHAGHSNDYKFHEEIGRLSSSLKEATRNRCYEEAGGREYEKIAPFVAAMYKVTSLQVQNTSSRLEQGSMPKGRALPFISFPWIFSSILGDLAIGRPIPSTSMIENAANTAHVSLTASDENISVNEVDANDKSIETLPNTKSTGPFQNTTHRGEILDFFGRTSAGTSHLEEVDNLLVFETVDDVHHISTTSSEESQYISESDKCDDHQKNSEGANDSERENEVERTIIESESLLERLARMHAT